MNLRKLSLRDKKIFSHYLNKDRRELSVYAFENIYIWKSLFTIEWAEFQDRLCVFFRDGTGAFMNLAPLGGGPVPEVTRRCFQVMDKVNKNKDVSRIENIHREDTAFYRAQGLDCRLKSYDYLCLRDELSGLSGDKFKSKRASCNYFIKHYNFEYLPFSLSYRKACLGLYEAWAGQRRKYSDDSIYQGMIKDSLKSFKALLVGYKGLNLQAALVKVDDKLKAFTFGFELNKDTFCILYEITDLSVKGIAQFIFQKFSSQLKGYRFINMMDDSGLENLKKVKLSYHPVRLVPAYIAARKNG